MYCKTQNSNRERCGVLMTSKEQDQYGMCGYCADHVWNEMTSQSGTYKWFHKDNARNKYASKRKNLSK